MTEAEDNPFDALEQAAHRQAAEEKALSAVRGARAALVMNKSPEGAFFATLALQMEVEADWKAETMETDGEKLFVNPDWCNALPHDERVGVVCHEVMHCVMHHQCRREGRDLKTWNAACDLAINQVIVGAGFKLPKSLLVPGQGKYKDFPKEKSAEEYYSLLSKPPKGGQDDEQGEDGGGGKDPGGCGGVRDAKDPAAAKDQESKWEVAAAQAEQASRGRGSMSAGLARLVGEALHPPANWKDILREFVTSRAKNDFSWSHPNRRFIAEGLYLPGLHSQELGEVVIAVDTSGSVGRRELEVFGSEIEAILGTFDCTATIVYHDAAVTRVDEWKSSDGPLKLNPVGGGGTSHVPVFEWIERENRSPACVVCLTDLYTCFPPAPSVPTLWAVVGGNTAQPPFGQAVAITNK